MSIQRQYNGLSLNDRIGFQNEAGLPKWGPLYRIAGMATIVMLIPSTAGTLGLYFSLASLVPWAAFSVLLAVMFLGLGSISISPSPAEMNGAHVL